MNLLLIEDNASTAERRPRPEKRNGRLPPVVMRLHRINKRGVVVAAEREYLSGSLRRENGGRAQIALELLSERKRPGRQPLVVAGTTYGCNATFVRGALEAGFEIVAELRQSSTVRLITGVTEKTIRIEHVLSAAKWSDLTVELPGQNENVPCRWARLGSIKLSDTSRGMLFAADVGALNGTHPGTIVGVTTAVSPSSAELISHLWWTRWIRPYSRRLQRDSDQTAKATKKSQNGRRVTFRSNNTLAQQNDNRLKGTPGDHELIPPTRQVLTSEKTTLNLAELFAGAGGMGLGFLMARRSIRRFRLVLSAEIEPIYVQTLRRNHEHLAKRRRGTPADFVPSEILSLNLRERKAQTYIQTVAKNAGGIDVLIGGPPCQGFSNANRNSWRSDNPHNSLVNCFMQHVEKLNPRVFVMENVQGIVWTAKSSRGEEKPSVADHIIKRMRRAGYVIYPKLLDAVWYGVPQFRTRFFVVGLHRDLGYGEDDFGEWGPFPVPTHGPGRKVPYATVREAIGDLPRIGNGCVDANQPYTSNGEASAYLRLLRTGAAKREITDHVTSRHADYVINRYRQIPAGGNWQDILHTMTNYADVSRTHSNIYRRLEWNKPAITIGHYRKSMLVHPKQHRGLSLREASRLQSFPDWFRFSGTEDGSPGGLMHKQQQLANAVCPLVSKILAKFILGL